MWCLEVIKYMNKPKPKEQKKDQEYQKKKETD